MSGPALTPLANIAPVTPPKSVDASPQEASGHPEADKAGTGFASELRRQMQDAPASGKEADPRKEDDAASSATDSQPTRQPELAALLGGLVSPGLPPVADKTTDDEAASLPAGDPTLPVIASTTPQTPVVTPLIPRAAAPEIPATSSVPTDTPVGVPAGNGQPPADTAVSTPAIFAAKPGKAEETPVQTGSAPTIEAASRNTEMPAPAPATNNFAAIHAAALANLQGAAPPPAPAPVPMHVATPAGSPSWPEEVGNRVRWMVGAAESHAELTLTPPQLGKVEVSITVSGDQTSAHFVTATPAARELIEQSLPRLREVLEQSGINLGQTDVGTSGQPGDPDRSARGTRWQGGSPMPDGTTSGPSSLVPASWTRRGEGLVDTFA